MPHKLTPAQLRLLRHLCGRNWIGNGPAWADHVLFRGHWSWVTDDDENVTRPMKALLDKGLAYKTGDDGRKAYATPAAHALLAQIDAAKAPEAE